MDALFNHANRAVARHMLAVFAVVVGAALTIYVGSEFLAAANELSNTIKGLQ